MQEHRILKGTMWVNDDREDVPVEVMVCGCERNNDVVSIYNEDGSIILSARVQRVADNV